jgi:hypothetical protein
MNESYTGKVYDLDFIENNAWCQALLRSANEENTLVVTTQEIRMQSILETSMILSAEVTVEFEGKNPSKLTRVKLNLG